jgi:uroporphyrinogen-III synthase
MRVLVARPEADAERTARRLAERGHEAIIAPVLRIERTDEPPPSKGFAAVVLTSANAVPALATIATGAEHWPIFAVGERTGSAAAEAGFESVHVAGGDATSLAHLIARTLPPRAKLLHIVGRDHKSEPERSLAKAGFPVSTWVAYEAVAAERLPPVLCAALRGGGLDAALHYSRRSAAVLLDLATAAGLETPLLTLTHVCLSADAAAPLRSAGAQRLHIAECPDEGVLLTTLDRYAGK